MSFVAVDLEALRREVNAAVGRGAEERFLYVPAHGSADCLDLLFRDWGVPRCCFNAEELVGYAAVCLKEEIAEKARILAVLERFAAGG